MRAAGLNFRDALIAIGMYPDDHATMGGEGAGVVWRSARESPTWHLVTGSWA
ncbi:hypothetical protein SANTM175S_03556 [Streptomyces antimycoticus]